MEKTCPQGVYYFLYPINILNVPVWGVLREGEQYTKQLLLLFNNHQFQKYARISTNFH